MRFLGRLAAGLVLLTALMAGCEQGRSFAADLALHYAPIIYQDTDDSDAEADYITRFDYDGNDVADDNWDNFDANRDDLRAVVYFSVVETARYWFLVYAFFHPRDWTDGNFEQEHENDLEGTLTIVEKDDTEFGKLVGILTVFHLDFFSYTPEGSPLRDGEEDVDGTLSMESWQGSPHPRITIEAKGHGVKAWPFAGDFSGNADEDGVIYRPDRSPSLPDVLPTSGNDRDVRYSLQNLIPFPGLWARQLQQASLNRDEAGTYATWGTLKGNESGTCGDGILVTCAEDSANLPWRWDDGDDGDSEDIAAGLLALDPAEIADRYFNGMTSQAEYVDNGYLEELRGKGYGPGNVPRGWPEGLDIGELIGKAP
jgi:hypothetical protein